MTNTPWIDINDRLPEFDKPVLTCIADREQDTCVIAMLEEVRVSESLEGKCISMDWREHRSGEYVSPTHWMPLIKPFTRKKT